MALLVVIGTFFHPMYSITNNIVLGHNADETPLAGLGLGALTIGVTGLSIGICFELLESPVELFANVLTIDGLFVTSAGFPS